MLPTAPLSPSDAERLDRVEQSCLDDAISEALLEEARSLDHESSPFPARARYLHANVRYRLNHDPAFVLSMFREAEEVARDLGDLRTQTIATIRQVEWAVFHDLYDQAEERAPEALALADALGEPYQRARALAAQGQIAYAREDWSLARERFEAGLALYVASGRPAHGNLARRRLGRCVAEILGVDALLEYGSVDVHITPLARAKLLLQVGTAWTLEAREAEALPVLAAALASTHLSAEDRAEAHYTKGVAYARLGSLEGAATAYQEALASSDASPEVTRSARSNLASARLSLGRFDAAELQYIFSEQAETDGESGSGVLVARATYWYRQGAFERALGELDRALDLAAGEESWVGCDIQQFRSHILFDLGRTDDAIAVLEQAENDLDERAPRIVRACVVFRFGFLYERVDLLAEAGEYYAEVLRLFDPVGRDQPVYYLALVGAARCMSARDDGEADELNLDTMLTELGEDAPPLVRGLLLSLRAHRRASVEDAVGAGRAYEMAGLPTDAADAWDDAALIAADDGRAVESIEYARSATRLLDDLLTVLPDDEARIGVQKRMRYVRGRLVRLLYESYAPQALAEAIRAKSSALLQLLRSRAGAHGEIAARLEHEATFAAAATLEAAISAASAPGALRSSTIATGSSDLGRVRQLYRDLTSRDGPAASLVNEWEVNVDAIVAAVPPGVAVVEYFLSEGDLFAFVVRADGISVARSDWTDRESEAFNAALHQFRPGPMSGSPRALLQRLLSPLRGLHDVLIRPILSRLADCDRLVIAPGARLASIPFPALWTPERGHLLERFDFSTVLSAAQLPALRPAMPPTQGTALLVRGDDHGAGERLLLHADAELESIAALLRTEGWRTDVQGPTSSRDEIFARASKADLIHFAGHANFSHAHGMAASLATPGAPTTAADLLTLDLRRTKLCVLSGCETGRPADNAGDEIVGMLRALSFAGASCVISSTWLADDASTAHLMRDTYTRWLRGARLDSALSGAARELLKTGGPDGSWRHPFFWANFSACGVV